MSENYYNQDKTLWKDLNRKNNPYMQAEKTYIPLRIEEK